MEFIIYHSQLRPFTFLFALVGLKLRHGKEEEEELLSCAIIKNSVNRCGQFVGDGEKVIFFLRFNVKWKMITTQNLSTAATTHLYLILKLLPNCYEFFYYVTSYVSSRPEEDVTLQFSSDLRFVWMCILYCKTRRACYSSISIRLWVNLDGW